MLRQTDRQIDRQIDGQNNKHKKDTKTDWNKDRQIGKTSERNKVSDMYVTDGLVSVNGTTSVPNSVLRFLRPMFTVT